MKLVRVGLIALLMVASACGQSKPVKGYDIGECGQGSFVAGHILVEDDKLTVDLASSGPGEVEKISVVYKKVDKAYEYVTKKGQKIDLRFDFDKKEGLMTVDGEPQAVLLVIDDQDGSKLAENAMKEFGVCQDLNGGADPDDAVKNLQKI